MPVAHGICYVMSKTSWVRLIVLHASRIRVYAVVADFWKYQYIDRAKQGWQENAAGGRNRTEATSLSEMGTCVGIAGGIFESDEE